MPAKDAEVQAAIEKVSDLIKLARGNETEEGRTAASKAIELIAKHRFLLVPEAEIQRLESAMKDAAQRVKTIEGEGKQKMFMGAVLGALLGKQLGV